MSEPYNPIWMHSEANARYLLRRGASVSESQRITTLPLETVELIAKSIAREPMRKLLIQHRRAIKRLAAGLDNEEVAHRTDLSAEAVTQLKKRLQTVRAMLSEGKQPEYVSQSLKIRLNVVLHILKDLDLPDNRTSVR